MSGEGHVPVLLAETVDVLNIREGGCYVDGTLGGAGHACEILRRANGRCRFLGIDRDAEALTRSAPRLSFPEAEIRLVQGRHGDLAQIARAEGFNEVDGVLLDLGVSSYQLDTPERGFSFRFDGPLDMRMDTSSGMSAAELVATASEPELMKLFKELGEEPQARRIASVIVRERAKEPIARTAQLAAIVEKAVGGRKGAARHPATRVFQALRMRVNGELDDLSSALDGALEILRPGGIVAVISFESLSDRVVKQFFVAHEGRRVSLHQGGDRWEGVLPAVQRVLRRAVPASEAEAAANPRARSAKLRAARRI